MRKRITAIVDWAQGTRPARVLRRYTDANGPLLAQGLSWQAIFATFAALWVGFAAAGFWLREATPLRDALIDGITTAVPGLIDTGEGGAVRLDQLLSVGVLGWTGAIAALGLIWTAISWFGSGRSAVRTVAGIDRTAGNFALLKLRDAGLALGFGLAVIASAALSLASTAFLTALLGWFGIDHASPFTTIATRAAGLLIVFAADCLLLWLFFRWAAGIRAPRRAMLEGVALGALALGVLKALGGLLLGGATSNPLLASFAVIIGLLIWFNFMCQVILLAAAWTAETGGLGRRSIITTSSAPKDSPAM